MVMEKTTEQTVQKRGPKFADWLIVIGFLAIPVGIWTDPRVAGMALWVVVLGIVIDFAGLKRRIGK